MSSLEWALLERLVGADAWVRLAAPAAAQPLSTLLLMALVAGLMLAIAHATRRVILVALLATLPAIRLDAAPDRVSEPTPRTGRAPRGARGPRAPGLPGRRLVTLATAA